MNRKQFLVSAASAALLEPITTVSNADAAPKSPLVISIPPTVHYLNERTTWDSDPANGKSVERALPTRVLKMPSIYHYLSVALQNVSAQPVRIWQEGNSWGACNLSLKVLAVDGKPLPQPVMVRREGLVFYKNVAQAEQVLPGETILRHVRLGPLDPKAGVSWAYIGFPTLHPGGISSVLMQAIFQIPPDRFTKEEKVWTGEITSPVLKYEVQSIKIVEW